MKRPLIFSFAAVVVVAGLSACSSTGTSVGELNYAIMNNDLTAVRSGIENGANVNGTNNQRKATPLHTAALYGNVAMVKELVGAGAEVEIADCSGTTPLMYAAQNGSVAVSRYLTENGANINRQIKDSNVTCDTLDPDGSALSVASAKNHPDLVRFLISKGAKAGGQRAFAYALSDPARDPIVKIMKSAGYKANEETARIIASLPADARTVNGQAGGQAVANNSNGTSDSGDSGLVDAATNVGGAILLNTLLEAAL